MSDIILSPNMNLPVPVVGVEAGPQWATDVNNSLNIIDSHSHVPGYGVLVPSAGIDINADLPFSGFNATLLKSARFSSQTSPLTGASPDLGCVYVSGADLYFNDTAGNQVRITQSGSVAGSAGTITGLPSGTASAAYASLSGTFTFLQATSTGANIDAATLIIRYPGSYPTPAGNYVALQAPSTLATGYALTLPTTLPAANNSFLSSSTAGVMAYVAPETTSFQVASSTLSIKAAAQAGSRQILVQSSNSSSLSVIRGVVDGAGLITVGEGFTAGRGGTGNYTISFATSFSGLPAVIATHNDAGAGSPPSGLVISVFNISAGAVQIGIRNLSGTATDAQFSFFAVGAR